MKHYVAFVTQDGHQKATRRMTRKQYVWQQMIVSAISFALGALMAWLCLTAAKGE